MSEFHDELQDLWVCLTPESGSFGTLGRYVAIPVTLEALENVPDTAAGLQTHAEQLGAPLGMEVSEKYDGNPGSQVWVWAWRQSAM